MWTDFIAKHAHATPDRTAIIGSHGREDLSYLQLHNGIQRWVGKLQSYGIRKGSQVAMLACNRVEHVIVFFACTRLRATLVPLNFRLASGEIQSQLQQLQRPLLITESEHPWQSIKGQIRLDQPNLPEVGPSYHDVSVEDEDILLMLFTSGSTGTPKGVMLSARMVVWNAINTQTGWQLTSSDRSIVQTPFFHTGGWNVLCLPLLRLGGALVLDEGNFDAADTLATLREQRITFYFAVPTMFSMLLAHPSFKAEAFASVRFCISGGAPCPAPLLETFRKMQIPLKQGFGLTECGPNCFFIEDSEALLKPDTVGRPMLHSRMVLLDDQDRPVPSGETGELCIGGPHVCSGYFGNEAAFAEVFRDGLFHTGDLMKQDADGCFYVVGRKKDMYISGGENVYPGEVEKQLLKHAHIDEAMVLAVPHGKWGEVGFAVYRGSADIALADLRVFLDKRLSRYKHPHHLLRLETWPLLPNGKIDRKQLLRLALEQLEVAHV